MSHELKGDLSWRHELTSSTYGLLENFALKQNSSSQKEDVPVAFSLMELKDSNVFMGQVIEHNSRRYELVLLFMNQIKAIKLEGGFMVSYNRLNIEDIKSKERARFTNSDYEKMATHYEHKTEQIHIVGEYAKKSIENYESSLAFVNDYFTLPYEDFLAQHFPNRKSEIRRPLTAERFKEIIKELDTDQTNVLKDNKSENILVLAGPGSGKTKVLVHKIASLLLLEDIKPEQFLMLTFSKAASMEFKSRTWKLVPEFAGLVKITTFHGFCFELLGQLGDIEKSENVIKECIEAIKSDEIDITSIKNKSVLLLDEVQDINSDEWKLIQTIIEVAGNLRVISVGDDDQNIYSFRGSSNSYMEAFQADYNATKYSLVKNYRSRSGIVSFNNQILSKISERMKSQELVPARATLQAKLKLVRYASKYLVKPLVESISISGLEGSRAVLVRTNDEALLVSSQLTELGFRTRLLAGFEGFSISVLVEIRFFSKELMDMINESGLILENDWFNCIDKFKEVYKSTPHYQTCLEIFIKFDLAYPDNKLLVDWRDYIREIKMEDAVHADSKSIIVSTMHKSKGKEFDHVWVLVEGYDTSGNDNKRLLYVACSRAKESLEIHTNGSFFNDIESNELKIYDNEKETFPPTCYELILNHKEINLNSQKYPSSLQVIDQLKTGDALKKDIKMFGESEALGLAKSEGGNMLLFSRKFNDGKFKSFQANGYDIVGGSVEYLLYWYDKDEKKEYKIVLPRLRFEKVDK